MSIASLQKSCTHSISVLPRIVEHLGRIRELTDETAGIALTHARDLFAECIALHHAMLLPARQAIADLVALASATGDREGGGRAALVAVTVIGTPVWRAADRLVDDGLPEVPVAPPNQARKAIMRAVTDSRPAVDFTDELAPGVVNLLTILECLTGTTRQQSRKRFDGAGYGTLKSAVADVVVERLTDIQRRYHEIVDDRSHLNKLLAQGAERARSIAADTLAHAYRACGLRS